MKTLIIFFILIPTLAFGVRKTRLPKSDIEFYHNNNYRDVRLKSNHKTTYFASKNNKLVKYFKKHDYRQQRNKQNQ